MHKARNWKELNWKQERTGILKSIVFNMNLICSCLSLQWRGGQGPLLYLAWWNPLQCANRGHLNELLEYKASKLVADGSYPTQETFSHWTFIDLHRHWMLLQMMHSQPSNEQPTCDLQQIPPPLSSSWERQNTLLPFRWPIWNAYSILSTSILRVGLTTGMDIMRHNGMFTQALSLGWILCLSSTSTVLTLSSI